MICVGSKVIATLLLLVFLVWPTIELGSGELDDDETIYVYAKSMAETNEMVDGEPLVQEMVALEVTGIDTDYVDNALDEDLKDVESVDNGGAVVGETGELEGEEVEVSEAEDEEKAGGEVTEESLEDVVEESIEEKASEAMTEDIEAVEIEEELATVPAAIPEESPEELTEANTEKVEEKPEKVLDIDYDALEVARYIMSWQLPSGGWTKNQSAIYKRYWDGKEAIAKYYQSDKVTPIGTIDNNATTSEIIYLAKVYQNSKDTTVKEAVIKGGLNYLLEMQYDSGGFPQVYPYQDHPGSNYENMVAFNDDAMTNVLWLYQSLIAQKYPFNGDLVSADLRNEIKASYYKGGIDFILQAQIVVNGKPTGGWCAQHDPVTYDPVRGRKFEPVSISGQESVSVAKFLMSVKGTDARIGKSIDDFVIWLKSVANHNMKYDRYTKTDHYFDYSEGDYMWYRFYEIGTNKALFADSDGSIYYDFF